MTDTMDIDFSIFGIGSFFEISIDFWENDLPYFFIGYYHNNGTGPIGDFFGDGVTYWSNQITMYKSRL